MMLKTKKKTGKIKHKSVAKLKGEVWILFSDYIRKRDCLRTTGDIDWGKCITCETLRKRGELDAGHFIQGRMNSILFDETCVHAQCRRCNRFRGGEPLKYRRAIIRLYGEGYDVELEEKAMETKGFTREELTELKKYFQSGIKELEQGGIFALKNTVAIHMD